MAKLYFYYGCVNSAKSLRLLSTAYNFEEKGIPFMVMKSSIDTRDGDGVIKSRAGLERECISVSPDLNIYSTIKETLEILNVQGVSKPKWILVDECQFLSEEQVNQLSDVVDFFEINVMCFGLRTDFKSRLFPATKRLFELGDEFEEVKSSCECGKKTSINARVDKDGNVQSEGSQILVGGDDIYHPICRRCWKEKIKRLEQEQNG